MRGRGRRHRHRRRRPRGGDHLAGRDRGRGRLAGAGADHRGAGGDLGRAAGAAAGGVGHRPGADGAAGRARRGHHPERHERLQRQRARLQLHPQPPGARAAGRPRPRHRLPRLAGMERHDPAARGPGQGGDGPRAGLRALRRQRLQRRRQHHDARRRARSSATGSRSRAASWRASGWTAGTPSVFADGRLGLRLNGGYNRSDTYSRSRTRFDGTSLQEEYAPATDEPVPLNREVLPLAGQTLDAAGDAVGDRDPLVNVYGAGRLDYYLDNGSVVSVDGGAVAGRERDLRDRHRPGAGEQGDQALRPRRLGRRAVQRLRLLEQPDLARPAVLAHLGPADRGALGHLPPRGADQLELPGGARPRGGTAPRRGTPRSTPPAR